MDNKYVTLFKELAQSAAISAEAVMEYDNEKNDTAGLEAATMMRDNYQNLLDRINFDEEKYVLDRLDASRLLVASAIQINQLQNQIKMIQFTIDGFSSDLMPKLQEIVDKATTDEEAAEMAESKFKIENN